MSLYSRLELTQPILVAQAFESSDTNVFQYANSMIILKDNTIYQLHRAQKFYISEEYQTQDFNNTINYPIFIYNFSVTTLLNDKVCYQTSNQMIILYSNFNLSLKNIIPQSKFFTYPMNLILDRQVGYCYLIQNYDQNQYFNLTQFSIKPSNISNNIQNYSLITQTNNQYFAFAEQVLYLNCIQQLQQSLQLQLFISEFE
ncbi:unnamed protein product [Paramecium sonneborni]|uniref:Uncharacterized protein n=1 Tax=Paramecium sonneborni TaxID=65129 RepID=A0A8S1RUJ9_9CILI|nr:unnamed protein product [Paramecium sonneborni]